jgi:Trp operon repressor
VIVPAVDYQRIGDLIQKGFCNAEIARRLGCGKTTVTRAAERLGLTPAHKRQSLDVALLFKLWASDMVKAEICQKLGVSVSHLSVLAKRHHLPKRRPVKCQSDVDPTPEEIEERAAKCRARRVHSERMHPSAGIRTYRYSSRTGIFTPGEIA